jgi:hexokinase
MNKCADIGLVLGTGMNIGYAEKARQITKLSEGYRDDNMIVNIEAGCFDKLPFGSLDRQLDAVTDNPGDHLLEKMTSGAYLGTLIGSAIRTAGESGLLSNDSADAAKTLGAVPLADASAFLADRSGSPALCSTENDREAIAVIIDRLVERDAKLIAAAISAIMAQADIGTEPVRPAVIAAEGSTFHKLYSFKDRFERYLSEQSGRHFRIVAADNATLLGTGYAALLNG